MVEYGASKSHDARSRFTSYKSTSNNDLLPLNAELNGIQWRRKLSEFFDDHQWALRNPQSRSPLIASVMLFHLVSSGRNAPHKRLYVDHVSWF